MLLRTFEQNVSGERINEDRLKYILDLLKARSEAFSIAGGWLNEMPWCRFIMPNLSGYSLITKMNQQISEVIEVSYNISVFLLLIGRTFN